MFKFFEKYGKSSYIILMSITTVTFVLSLFVNYFSSKGVFFDNVTSISEMSDKYLTLITPASFTFGIWGFIYTLSIILLFVWWKMLFNNESSFDEQCPIILGFLIISILNPLWILVWVQEKILLSWIVMLLLLIVIILTVLRLERSHFALRLAKIFFNVYLGWISVAFSVNTAVLLISQGIFTNEKTAVILTIGLLIIITLLASYALWSRNNLPYVLVIIWALIGIFARLKYTGGHHYLLLASTILIAALMLCTAYYLFRSRSEK